MRAPKKYKLPGCLVLFAAVLATRKAYEFAMANLPIARQMEDGK